MSSVRSCWRSCWCLLALALCATAASARQLRLESAGQPRKLALAVGSLSVVPEAPTWSAQIATDQQTAIVGVEGSGAAPARVRYTVSFALNVTYVLTGSVAISSTGTEPGAQAAQAAPSVTITPASGAAFLLPPSAVVCPSLEVPAGRSAECAFRAPLPEGALSGSVSATLQGRLGAIEAPVRSYSVAEQQQLAPVNISNYFEPGEPAWPNVLPVGVDGVQPPTGTHISRGTTYEYTAVLGSLPQSKCGQQGLQVINTATIRGAAPGGGDVTAVSVVVVELAGCDGLQTAPARGAASFSSYPGPQQQQQLLLGQGQALSSAAPGCPSDSVLLGGECCRSWNVCNDKCCSGGASCVGGQCCPESQKCGDTCCGAGTVCDSITNTCCQAGGLLPGGGCCAPTSMCGAGCCPAGQICVGHQTCCLPDRACGVGCCEPGSVCLGQLCCPVSQLCGSNCCTAGFVCSAGQCVPPGGPAFASTYAPAPVYAAPAPQQPASGINIVNNNDNSNSVSSSSTSSSVANNMAVQQWVRCADNDRRRTTWPCR